MSTNDYTYRKLKYMIKYNEMVVFKKDNDSSIVITDKNDYVNKLEEIIKDLIRNGVYETSRNTTLDDLRKLQSILCKNVKILEHYDNMKPVSKRPESTN